MRVVLIDPETRTVTEEQIGDPHGLFAMMEVELNAPLETPVENSQTGDKIYVNPLPGPSARRFTFLGAPYYGRAVIAGRDVRVDAAVPLARVRGQVRWGAP